MSIRRRELLRMLGGVWLTSSMGDARLAWAAAPNREPGRRRFVLVLLRGGLDGLSAVPAWGDPDFERARAGIAVPPPGEPGGALDLDGFFALHPALPRLHARWAAGELAVVHAHCIPYRARSHFDAQNVLEGGGTEPHALDSGWLNRALGALADADASRKGPEPRAIAIASAMPLALQGDVPVGSWSPSRLPSPAEDLLDRIEALYGDDDRLAAAFGEGRETNELAGGTMGAAPGRRAGNLEALSRAAGRFLAATDGPRVAVLEAGGWDTHSAQERPRGSLHRNYQSLDGALDALRLTLGDAWQETVVLVLTEFGRTVAMNGSSGTDHGTGGAGFLVGGAVRGGQVVADWPGLARSALHEARDLRATIDTRAVMKAALGEHLGVPREALDRTVFPGSSRIAPTAGLLRTRDSSLPGTDRPA